MLTEALSRTDGPGAIRYPPGPARPGPTDEVGSGLKARKIRSGGDVCLLGVGKMVEAVEEAAGKLEAEGVMATVWDVRVVKPLDAEMLADAARHPLVVTAEDGIRVGGAGTAIADALVGLAGGDAPPTVPLGTPSQFIPHGEAGQIHHALGLDGPGIAASVLEALDR